MTKIYPDSEVEVQSWMAKYYDNILNIASLGIYPLFIRKSISKMNIQPHDQILDFGAGTGRNAMLMNKYLSEKGRIVGLDIGSEMIKQFKQKTEEQENIDIYNKRIDQPLNYKNDFDKVFISFVLHGFPQEVRKQVIQNAYQALKPGGYFIILDFNEFDLEEMSIFTRIPFKTIECRYAFDFIEKDWKAILSREGFQEFQQNTFFFDYVRLLKAKKR